MNFTREVNAIDLARLGGLRDASGEPVIPMARMLDSDGDGRNDLFLVDFDLDGRVDGVVRALDVDGDGTSDVFVHYAQDGAIQAIGQLDPESGDLEIVAAPAEGFDGLLADLDPSATALPDSALFTRFDDPSLEDVLGSVGEPVPEGYDPALAFADVALTEVAEDELTAAGSGATLVEGSEEAPGNEPTADAAPPETPEVTARVVEIEDYSGGNDGSDLHARIDRDGDGLADDDEKLFRTSDGTWHGDIDADGYSEAVAFDQDGDGRIESVDTTGQGGSLDRVGAEQVVDAASEGAVDRRAGEDELWAEDTEVVDSAWTDTDLAAAGAAETASDLDNADDDDLASADITAATEDVATAPDTDNAADGV